MQETGNVLYIRETILSKSNDVRLRKVFYAFMLLIFLGCSKEKIGDDDCQHNQTARLIIKNTLSHGMWVDARTHIHENNDKRFLMPQERFVYETDTGEVHLTTSFTSNDNEFIVFRNMNVKACQELEIELKSVCTLFNTAERVSLRNNTEKPIVVDIKMRDRYWAGENIIQPQESFTYNRIMYGNLVVFYRYIDNYYWRCSQRFFVGMCINFEYSCEAYGIEP